MIKEIRYGGLSAQPNEYISEDGESALLMNLVPEKDGLQPMSKGVMGFAIKEEGIKIFTHKPEDKTNYIAYGNGKVQWVANEFESAFSEPKEIFATTDEIVAITSLGNVIIVSTTTAMHYARWDAQNDVYVYLGTQVPKIKMEFGLGLNLEFLFDIGDTEKPITLVNGDDGGKILSKGNDWKLIARSSWYDYNIINTTQDGVWEVYSLSTNAINGQRLEAGYEYRVVVHTSGPLGFGSKNPCIEIWDEDSNKVVHSQRFMLGNYQQSYVSRLNFKLREDVNNFSIRLIDVTKGVEVAPKMWINTYRGVKLYPNDDTGKLIEHTQDNFNHITGLVNKFINEQGAQSNRFIYPFFVRYGVKMWDNNYSYISAPILMIPNSGYAPYISCHKWEDKEGKLSDDKARLLIASWVGELQYKAITDNISKWENLIVGVDVFVSSPIYSYNQGFNFDTEKYAYVNKQDDANNFGVGVTNQINEYADKRTKLYLEKSLNAVINYPNKVLNAEVAPFSAEDIIEKASNVDSYYLIKSIALDELKQSEGEFASINLDEGTLNALQAREDLVDTTQKKTFADAKMIVYNNRLSLHNGKLTLPNAYLPSECATTYSTYWENGQFLYDDINLYASEVVAYVHLKTNQGERIQKISESTNLNESGSKAIVGAGWLYYPDATAYKATIFFKLGGGDDWVKGEYLLKPHNYLDGAYWIGESIGVNMIEQAQYANIAEVEDWANDEINNTLSMQNTIYTSEAENPWTFAIANSKKIGDGSLIGIASATKALSEGQFGQFPLYAFTTDGVWSLSVTSEGLFKPAQPITRDVCISANSITQLDQAVLFASDRGIMLLEGSNASCITDKIESENPIDINALKGGDKVAKMSGIAINAFNTIPFEDFVKGCSMTYDYMHQRVILYNKEYSYAYIFSLESQAWGMMESNIEDKINSYPDAIVVTKDGKLLNLSKEDKEDKEDETKAKGLMITRALKLDDGDVLKTINTIVQRGDFNRGDVSTILWGSRDLKNWHLVWSSKDHYMRGFRGTPYKYYRIGAITNLDKDESIIGASINYETKQTNQLR